MQHLCFVSLALLLSQAGAEEQHIIEIFKPLPRSFENARNPGNESKVTLGRMLFFEARLSKNQDVSCNSCHDVTRYGVDGMQFSTGHKGQKGGRNAPTVYNAGDHIAQFWDGRAADLEAQAKGPILNPIEMAMNEKRVLATLRSIPQYGELFKKAFPGDKQPLTYDNVGKAIAAFERGLVTPGRFDKFIAGDKNALTAPERAGMRKFFEYGCTTCHNGAAVGGGSFQRLGLVKPFPNQKDLGRFAVTKQDTDKMVFRVPSLRNIDKTGPYMHDGAVNELKEMVRIMGRHQLGKEVADADVDAIVTFLRALTGDIPSAYVQKPELPPSTPKTPKPDPS
jgi:cytochrome c peroxidase